MQTHIYFSIDRILVYRFRSCLLTQRINPFDFEMKDGKAFNGRLSHVKFHGRLQMEMFISIQLKDLVTRWIFNVKCLMFLIIIFVLLLLFIFVR